MSADGTTPSVRTRHAADPETTKEDFMNLRLVLATGFFGALCAAQGYAIELTPLPVGSTQSGQLSMEDAINSARNTRADRYRLELTEAGAYAITLRSSAFDTYLFVYDETGSEVDYDDDSAGNLDSRVILLADGPGTYEVEATSYSQATGPYDLIVTRLESNAPTAALLALGSPTTGSIDTSDAVDAQGYYVDLYELDLAAGDYLDVQLSSTTEDMSVELSTEGGELVASSTYYGGPGRRMTALVAREGTYRLAVRSSQPGSEYQISATRRIADEMVPDTIELGEAVEISYGDGNTFLLPYGDEVQRYRVPVEEDVAYLVTLEASEGYGGLSALSDSGYQLSTIYADYGRGTGVFVAPSDGYVLLEITGLAYLPEDTTYSVLVEEAGQSEADSDRIRPGDSVEGVLEEGDAASVAGFGYIDLYELRAERGERVTVSASLGGDMNMQITAPTGEPITDMMGNPGIYYDDHPSYDYEHDYVYDSMHGPMDSRFYDSQSFTTQLEGSYMISVRGSTGTYTLSVETADPSEPMPIQLGNSVSGLLEPGDDTQGEYGALADRYTLELSEVVTADIALTADANDSYLEIRGAYGELVAANDDYDGLNSRIITTLQPGTYTIIASEFDRMGGAYELSVNQTDYSGFEIESIVLDATMSASLEGAAPSAVTGYPTRYYAAEIDSQRLIQVQLDSSDTSLYADIIDPLGRVVGSAYPGSLANVRAITPGIYHILVRSYGQGAPDFELTVR